MTPSKKKGKWAGWSVVIHDLRGEVETREKVIHLRDLARVVGRHAGKRILHVYPALTADQRGEIRSLVLD